MTDYSTIGAHLIDFDLSSKYLDVSDVELIKCDYDSQLEEYDDALAEIAETLEDMAEGGQYLTDDYTALQMGSDRIARCRGDLIDEGAAFLEFASDVAGYCSRGDLLISEEVFTAYITQQAYELGQVTTEEWPHNHIDWDAAAGEAKHNYTTFEYQGTTYYHA